ncbi:hypothetical protein L202_06763 [Cryptococcus amylolentus CBS 6039]|uniref:Glycosyl hydrolase family 32 C-terminal domain-containing protein n=1 Tax=Cryptococcus amylolentus CBS 6039 TaxID=1295533 RepID=A0A1E3HDD7_9TREE|nr:hypothetical protein L202_06763 [Cryptococcus amylolentus CBS 6039]ODN74347.1 hypothetical protein L202_06763 [Cryptococcus amylolentus CBS 6039]
MHPKVTRTSFWSGDLGINWERTSTNFINLETATETRKREDLDWLFRCAPGGFPSNTFRQFRPHHERFEGNRQCVTVQNGVMTLGNRPIHELQSLRGALITHRAEVQLASEPVVITSAPLASEILMFAEIARTSKHFNLSARGSLDVTSRTDIHYLPQEQRVCVDRSLSNTQTDINTVPEEAPFTLFELNAKGNEHIETLEIRVFLDYDHLHQGILSVILNTAVRLDADGGATVRQLDIWEINST